jgi:hypothetical protein
VRDDVTASRVVVTRGRVRLLARIEQRSKAVDRRGGLAQLDREANALIEDARR